MVHVCLHWQYNVCITVVVYLVESAPTNVMAVQEGLTSIRVSWSPPSQLGNTTGYRIEYTSSDDSSDNVTVDDGSTAHPLTGLQNGERYNIFIVATSDDLYHIPRISRGKTVSLGM